MSSKILQIFEVDEQHDFYRIDVSLVFTETSFADLLSFVIIF
jgi:hypothetical protein